MASRFFDGSCTAKAIGLKYRPPGSCRANAIGLTYPVGSDFVGKAAASGAIDREETALARTDALPASDLETACGVSYPETTVELGSKPTCRGPFQNDVVKGVRFVGARKVYIAYPKTQRVCFCDFPCDNYNDPLWRAAVVDFLSVVGKPILVYAHPQGKSQGKDIFLGVWYETPRMATAAMTQLLFFDGSHVKPEAPRDRPMHKRSRSGSQKIARQAEWAHRERFLSIVGKKRFGMRAYSLVRGLWRKREQRERQQREELETG